MHSTHMYFTFAIQKICNREASQTPHCSCDNQPNLSHRHIGRAPLWTMAKVSIDSVRSTITRKYTKVLKVDLLYAVFINSKRNFVPMEA